MIHSSAPSGVAVVPFLASHANDVVQLWRISFQSGVGVAPMHTMQQQRDYLLEKVLPHFTVCVALVAGRVVGFVAASNECIDQLYVHTEYQRRGIGSRLLAWAKNNSGGHLYLYTFERNIGAQRFYEAQGFQIVARGFEQQWQLADIRYEWHR